MGTACWIERVRFDIEVKRLFYATVNTLILDQWGVLTDWSFFFKLFKPGDAQYVNNNVCIVQFSFILLFHLYFFSCSFGNVLSLCVWLFCLLLFNSLCYLFLLLCTLCSAYSVSIVPPGTLRLPWLRFFRPFIFSCTANSRV